MSVVIHEQKSPGIAKRFQDCDVSSAYHGIWNFRASERPVFSFFLLGCCGFLDPLEEVKNSWTHNENEGRWLMPAQIVYISSSCGSTRIITLNYDACLTAVADFAFRINFIGHLVS